MIATSLPTTVGVFKEPAQAARAVQALQQAGFPRPDIGLASPEWDEAFREVRVDLQQAAEHGATRGAWTGGVVGAALGLAGAALLPGAPIFLGAFGSALAGAAAGSVVGPFVAMGLSDAQARAHAKHLEQGNAVVVVRTADRREEAHRILMEQGAYDDTMTSV